MAPERWGAEAAAVGDLATGFTLGKSARQIMPYALLSDDTIVLRLAMFQHQQEVLKQQMG